MRGRAPWPAAWAGGPRRASRSHGAARRSTWSSSGVPIGAAPSATARVNATSSSLGVGSPLGWLCTSTNALAASRSTMRSGSRAVTCSPWMPPEATRRARTQAVPAVEREHPELLVVERRQARARPGLDRGAVRQLGARVERGGERGPAPELDRRRDARRLRRTHARMPRPARRCPRARARRRRRGPRATSPRAPRRARPAHPVPSTSASSSASPRHSTPASTARSRGPLHVVSVVMTACLSKPRAAAGHRGSAGKPRGRACPGRFAGCPGTGGAGLQRAVSHELERRP